MIIFQLNSISDETKKSLATILPAVTSAALAIQLKLSWSEKSSKAKRSKQNDFDLIFKDFKI